VDAAAFWTSAILLAIERLAYVLVWRAPGDFRRVVRLVAPGASPVDVLAALFVVFKVLQVAVFAGWCLVHGGTVLPRSTGTPAVVWGALLVACGQALNVSVFARLGRTGVFYGSRLGHEVPWVRGFPFSWFSHPQYVGTVLSIWGVFIALRFPEPDWFALPVLETLYYVAGAQLEREPATDDPVTDV
jgi:methylene-fatty-acyl-phospholipid synthase